MTWLTELLAFNLTNLLGLYLYWFPVGICLVGYAVRTVHLVKKDLKNRREAALPGGCYIPGVTVGSILGMVLISWIPLVNLLAAAFDLTPKFIPKLCDWFRDLLDIPLVPRRKKTN